MVPQLPPSGTSNLLLGNRSGNSIGDVYLIDFGSVQTIASQDGGMVVMAILFISSLHIVESN
jgi:hypothetical protein